MVVMKHLLQRQQAGGPGSPPAWKCHDRFPLVIATVFLQRLKGTESHRAIIRHPSPCTPGLAHSCTPPPSRCPLPSMGSSRCRQGGQQAEGPAPTTSPCTTWVRRCPTHTIPIHPWQEWKRSPTFRKLFKSLTALPNKAHTWLFPADINLEDLPSSPQRQI